MDCLGQEVIDVLVKLRKNENVHLSSNIRPIEWKGMSLARRITCMGHMRNTRTILGPEILSHFKRRYRRSENIIKISQN